jgi:K+ transporter
MIPFLLVLSFLLMLASFVKSEDASVAYTLALASAMVAMGGLAVLYL